MSSSPFVYNNLRSLLCPLPGIKKWPVFQPLNDLFKTVGIEVIGINSNVHRSSQPWFKGPVAMPIEMEDSIPLPHPRPHRVVEEGEVVAPDAEGFIVPHPTEVPPIFRLLSGVMVPQDELTLVGVEAGEESLQGIVTPRDIPKMIESVPPL